MPRFDEFGGCPAGVTAYQQARQNGQSVRDACVAFFIAEPEAKAHLLSRPVHRVATVIADEESRAIACIEANEKRVRRLFPDPSHITGEQLARLHHTHGCDPETVQAILGNELPATAKGDYQKRWEEHCRTGDGK